MIVRNLQLVTAAVGLSCVACASSPAIKGTSEIEVVFKDARPPRAYEEVAPVEAFHWNVDTGIDELKRQARKLEADAVVEVEYSAYTSTSSDQFEMGRRPVSSGGQVVFEFNGLAVRWDSNNP